MGRGPWENVTGREIALVREINRSVILNCLRETSPLSRAQLAEITGLNRTAVSGLVRELIARQFVRKIGFDSSESRFRRGYYIMRGARNPDSATGAAVKRRGIPILSDFK